MAEVYNFHSDLEARNEKETGYSDLRGAPSVVGNGAGTVLALSFYYLGALRAIGHGCCLVVTGGRAFARAGSAEPY